MKFLCLGYFDREAMDALPKADVDALMGQCIPHMDVFHGTGQVLVDAGLDIEARSLRRRKGKIDVVDGPYVETKEMVGSAFLIDAVDMEDAIRVASLHPATQVNAGEPFGWGLEIRPIHYFKTPETPDVTWRPQSPSE